MWAEWLLYGLAGLIGLLVLIGGPMSAGWISPRTAITLTVCFFVFPGIAVLSRMQAIDRAAHYATTTAFDVPSLRTDQLFAGSNSCRACHAAEYDSWHASFHRTMTQVASPEAVVAPFDGRTLTRYGQEASVERRGDEFWVEMVEPEFNLSFVLQGQIPPRDDAPRTQRRIVMTTGSHSFQAYWYIIDESRELWLFPWRYLIADRLWIHVDDVFVQPPADRPALGHNVWNQSCIQCHSVGGQPGSNPLTHRFDNTHIAELGISCEACHGPAFEHIQTNQNPLRRYSQHLRETPDSTIFNPVQTDHATSSQACGICHSNFDFDGNHPQNKVRFEIGNEFRPGISLNDRGRFMTVADERIYQEGDQEIAVSRFWADGACRSGGREYNGLIESACFKQGQISCLSCHQLHGDDPDDQLRDGMRTNRACLQCHASVQEDIPAHTHHAEGSSGSLCMNCHMPHSSFALLRGIRSHRIDNPTVVPFGQNVRLNACNLCHLDKTQAWTAGFLAEWYSTEAPALSADDQNTAASILWLLKGDGGQRSLSAWHLGWPEAKAVAGTSWMTPFLTAVMSDPYSAVRYNAWKALRAVSSISDADVAAVTKDLFEDLTGDRNRVSNTLRLDWMQRASGSGISIPEPLLGTQTDSAEGPFSEMRLRELLNQRDDRPMVIVE